jgi:hypothetical protein
MRPRYILSATLWIFLSVAGAVAQSPFAGTWKLNQEKSQLAGDVMKFGPAAEDSIELTAGGMTYSFRTDGNNYAMPTGNLAIWRQTGPDSWSTEYRTRNGKLLSSDSWKLSADGKGLTVVSSGVKANGDLYTDQTDYVRTAGPEGTGSATGSTTEAPTEASPGSLIGSWKSTTVKLGSPSEFVIQEAGLDALMLKIPAMKASCQATLDGKETAVEGPDVPTGLRISLTRTGPYSFQLVQKLNGKTISTSVYTVAGDGKTMTEVGGAPEDPPATLTWEKQ